MTRMRRKINTKGAGRNTRDLGEGVIRPLRDPDADDDKLPD